MKSLNCRKAEEWIVADLDEGLNDEKRLILEDHLSGCASCRKMREDTALLLSEVAADAPEDPGEAFWKLYRISLDARLRERKISRPWSPWRLRAWSFGWKPASALAMAILVFVTISIGISHLWNSRPSADEAVSPQLIGELNELYGPVSDELPYFALTSSDAQLFQASRSPVLDDSSVEWFEIEDEPNQLFL
jgi:predicted anti-sigma-YlaC factor YlaD